MPILNFLLLNMFYHSVWRLYHWNEPKNRDPLERNQLELSAHISECAWFFVTKEIVYLHTVVLLIPSPWMGKIKMRPLIRYGPISSTRGPFNRISYFPSIFSLKPLYFKYKKDSYYNRNESKSFQIWCSILKCTFTRFYGSESHAIH